VPAFELELVRVLRMRGVVRRVGLSRSTVDRLVRRGKFPRPIQLTPWAVGWRIEDIDRWVAERDVVSLTTTAHESALA
jgi:prophage regulatory protein